MKKFVKKPVMVEKVVEKVTEEQEMIEEGSVQYLCKNGHYYGRDTGIFMGGFAYENVCPTCGEHFFWENSIDDTNGESMGLIDISQFVSVPAKTCTCACCGNIHVIEPTRYRIPTAKETKAARTYWDEAAQTYKPLSEKSK